MKSIFIRGNIHKVNKIELVMWIIKVYKHEPNTDVHEVQEGGGGPNT